MSMSRAQKITALAVTAGVVGWCWKNRGLLTWWWVMNRPDDS